MFQAAVVRLVRENLKVMSLAIGDGANDVSMLQMAEVIRFISCYINL